LPQGAGSAARSRLSLAERRQRVFVLIGAFHRALARPRGLEEAIGILRRILSCSRA